MQFQENYHELTTYLFPRIDVFLSKEINMLPQSSLFNGYWFFEQELDFHQPKHEEVILLILLLNLRKNSADSFNGQRLLTTSQFYAKLHQLIDELYLDL